MRFLQNQHSAFEADRFSNQLFTQKMSLYAFSRIVLLSFLFEERIEKRDKLVKSEGVKLAFSFVTY